MDALSTTLFWLDYAAVAVFGATGALAAAHRKHDIITFGFFAAITGVGGGTLRDLLIDAPVFVDPAAGLRDGLPGRRPGGLAAGPARLAVPALL